MEPIELTKNQVERFGKLVLPKLEGYTSLHFHPLTKDYDSSNYTGWGLRLTNRCKKKGTQYYFLKTGGRKINVYPSSEIDEWFMENGNLFLNAEKSATI